MPLGTPRYHTFVTLLTVSLCHCITLLTLTLSHCLTLTLSHCVTVLFHSLCHCPHCLTLSVQVDQAAKSYATEVDKMQQQVIRRDSLTRRDSFTALDDEEGFANNWHKATMI